MVLEESIMSNEAAEKLLAEKRFERAIAVPTEDRDVRRMLRELSEPITYFGEDKVHRRERLRKLLAQKQMEGQAIPQQAIEIAMETTGQSMEIPVRFQP